MTQDVDGHGARPGLDGAHRRTLLEPLRAALPWLAMEESV